MTSPSSEPLVRLLDSVTTPERADAYAAAGYWRGETLSDRVTAHSRARTDEIAVVDRNGSRRRTFGEVQTDVEELAHMLSRRGVGVGSVVSIQMPNCYEAVIMALATQSLGGVINPLLTTYGSHELAYVYDAAHPVVHFTPLAVGPIDYRAIVTTAGGNSAWLPLHVPVDLGEDVKLMDWFNTDATGRADEDQGPRGEWSVDPGRRVSEVIFTSGTESTPKAVMHTEHTANFSVRTAYTGLGLEGGDSVWMPSPIGHSTGFNYGVRFALYHGLKLVLQDSWSAELAYDLVKAEQCTYTLAATTFLHDLVQYAAARRLRLSHLKYFGCGGAPVPGGLVRAAEDLGVIALRLYGATEFLVATWNRPTSTLRQRQETDGMPLEGVEVEVRDEAGNGCPRGTSGEVWVRGPNTCVGFFADRERTAAAFDESGWIRSGDLGVLEDDGYLALIGRKKDIIIRGGLNIAPRELEEALIAFPEVWQAAVIGVPDERLGERTCACLVLRAGHSIELDDVVERLLDQGFAKYKLPQVLRTFEQFPMTPSGKIQKHELRRLINGRDT